MPERNYKDYKKYKPWLREDFAYRCAYCFIHENEHGGYWHFQVDHYRPKSRSEFKHLETEYTNLLYCCDHCNNLKGDIWPSDDPLTDGLGWLDPCEHNLEEHYYYGYCDESFTLIYLSKVGHWMATYLALDQPPRIIRRRVLADEERLDAQMIKQLRMLIEKWEYSGENFELVADYRQLLLKFEEKMRNRYIPQPFISLRRGKSSS